MHDFVWRIFESEIKLKSTLNFPSHGDHQLEHPSFFMQYTPIPVAKTTVALAYWVAIKQRASHIATETCHGHAGQ